MWERSTRLRKVRELWKRLFVVELHQSFITSYHACSWWCKVYSFWNRIQALFSFLVFWWQNCFKNWLDPIKKATTLTLMVASQKTRRGSVRLKGPQAISNKDAERAGTRLAKASVPRSWLKRKTASLKGNLPHLPKRNWTPGIHREASSLAVQPTEFLKDRGAGGGVGHTLALGLFVRCV